MNDRSKLVLAGLFFGALLGLWYVESARIPSEADRQRMTGRILPALIDTDLATIDRIDVDRPEQPMKLRRDDNGRWMMIEPIATLANQTLVEALLGNLKLLRRLPDTAAIDGPPKDYGFGESPPRIQLYRRGESIPMAVLEAGSIARDHRYVRGAGGGPIEVVEAQPLLPMNLAADDWRERAIFPMSPLDVIGLTVDGPGRVVEVARAEGRWRLLRPLEGQADLAKLDGVLADLTSLQVARDVPGFVADQVTDFRPYGLDAPRLTVRLTPDPKKGTPWTLHVGNESPDHPGRVFARRGDRPEVLLVNGRSLAELGVDAHALRSRRLAEFDPSRVVQIAIRHNGVDHELFRRADGWECSKPSTGRADRKTVEELLKTLSEAEASAFLAPTSVDSPGFDQPTATVRIWEVASDAANSTATAPVLDLTIGRVDSVKKTAYSHVAGDTAILAVPDVLLDTLPAGPLALRDRVLVTLGRGRIDHIVRASGPDDRVEFQASGEPLDFNRWQMTAPVAAPADGEAIARLTVMLSALRAEELIEADPVDLGKYGLIEPALAMGWRSRPLRRPGPSGGPASGTLLIGAPVRPDSESRFAKIDDVPLVFSLAPQAIGILQAELRDRLVIDVPVGKARRLEIRVGDRVKAWVREPGVPGVPGSWKTVEADATASPSPEVDRLVGPLARLATPRFVQYQGAFRERYGLNPPAAVIQLTVDGRPKPLTLNIGAPADGTTRFATLDSETSGAVFLVPQTLVGPWIGETALPAAPFAREPE